MSKRSEKKLAAFQNAIVEQHYAEVENMYRKMREWRHDYHNHIQALATMLEQGDIEKAREFLYEIHDTLTKVDTVLKTGNTMVDAILNSKISLMYSKNIRVDATAKVPAELTVKDIDLCVIIGNLLDNAMEACEKLPEGSRFIRIYISVKGNHLYMSFTNLTAQGKLKKNEAGTYSSTKSGMHGFGLMRVDSIVNKYGGYINRASEDGAFTTEVLLPQAR